jgi:hypothetical protein
MKRALLMGILALTAVAAVGAAPAVTVGSASGAPGSSVAIPVTFATAPNTVSGIQFSLTLPANMSAGLPTAGSVVTSAGKMLNAHLNGAA